jgi:hypothetical protein
MSHGVLSRSARLYRESDNKLSKPLSEYGPPANFPRPMSPAAVAAAQNEETTTNAIA